MRKIGRITAIILVLALLCAGCAQKNVQPVSDTALMLDTVVTIKIYGQDELAEDAIAAAFDEIARLDKLLSANVAGNDLDRLAQNAGRDYIDVAPEVLSVLQTALAYAELTNGAFDPTVGPLVKLWSIKNGTGHVPTQEELSEAMALIGYDRVLVDGGRVLLRDKGMSLDLGAIAKGYIADRVKELLLSLGVEHANISLGGNVVVYGGKQAGVPYVVGIQDPRGETGDVLASVERTDASLVSSGDYERYFEQDGVRYHHILDPRTGYPAKSGLSGVTILTDGSVDGDALSTAVFILGKNEGLELIESIEGAECILVSDTGGITLSTGLANDVTIYQ